jgi:hypothetical protein
MGNYAAVPTFRKTYHVSDRKASRASITLERASATTDRANYHVYCNSSIDAHSSSNSLFKNERKRRPQTNRIKTTRYNILTFIPKNLFDQFRRVANIYFLTLIGLNWVPAINAISKNVGRRILDVVL